MLSHLYIENYALIRQLDISFNDGFSVITGETGAGKSILIGALSLILGQRADTTILFDKNNKCIIEGTFNLHGYGLKFFFENNDLDYDDFSVLRREINPLGKSRAFINDTPVNLNILKDLGDRLVDVHSQHKTITLNDADFQLTIIDNFAKHNEKVNEYRKKFIEFRKKKQLLNNLILEEEKSKADLDYQQFLLNELQDAKLIEGEQESIEEEIKILTHAEDIKNTLFNASQILSGNDLNILSNLAEITSLLNKLSAYHSRIKEIYERLNTNLIDLKDIAAEIDQLEQQVHYDPENLEKFSNRLDLIYRLQQKHHASSIKELISRKDEISNKLFDFHSIEGKIKELRKETDELSNFLTQLAVEISQNRSGSIPDIKKALINRLLSLGMPDARFEIILSENEHLTLDGKDNVKFLFNANKGGNLLELSRVASGGELSRLMLGVKSLISQKNLLPTLVFDEIDIGVSGEIAGKVGKIMQEMSKSMQVIAITHLPQIAGKSDHHYLVYKYDEKNHTYSAIKKLTDDERIKETAKMLSNERISEAAVATAKELIKK